MASKRHKLFWGSSYDRGLDVLLFMWPDIIEKFPEAELHICYGWNLFDKGNRTNPERMAWKESVQNMMRQKGIHHHGRVGQDKLKKIRESCGIWAYPTYFTEINCITALETQREGLVPVTMALAALEETVGAGVKLPGNIRDPKVQQEYLKELLDMMDDKKKWRKESIKAQEFAKGYSWKHIARDWDKVFKRKISTPKVSVITVTIREGFWNIMAENIARQTYEVDEWVIVDDHKEDRSKIAEKYAEKYGINIKYIRGDKAKGIYKRKYGLVRANNIGWQNASGELLVWLQDFILMPTEGVEHLVDIYRHNKDALIAPTDIFYSFKKPNMDNKEDWWDGDTDIIKEKTWTNNRNQNAGIRETDNPLEFEMNYAATPRKIIEHLNGWWEFMDDALGYDNTEIAKRALDENYRVIVDDTNQAKCIDLDLIVKRDEKGRSDAINMWKEFNRKNLPNIRNDKLDTSDKE